MPLSEHEQKLLDQIEQALYAEDPRFASAVSARDLRGHHRRRILRSAVLFVAGMLLLLAGVVVKFLVLGVLGFVVMLVATLMGISSWQWLARHRGAAAAVESATPWRDRLEERWRRRGTGSGPN